MDISANLLAAPYCTQFNQILILAEMQRHAPYPKEWNLYEMYSNAVDFIRRSHHSAVIRARAQKVGKVRYYIPRCFVHPCIRMPRDVNYVDVFEKAARDNP